MKAQSDSLGCRFHGRAAGEILVGVVPQQAHVGDFRPGGKMPWNIIGAGHDPLTGHGIHVRNVSRLQRSASTQGIQRRICTAVRNDNGIFHGNRPQLVM